MHERSFVGWICGSPLSLWEASGTCCWVGLGTIASYLTCCVIADLAHAITRAVGRQSWDSHRHGLHDGAININITLI